MWKNEENYIFIIIENWNDMVFVNCNGVDNELDSDIQFNVKKEKGGGLFF